MKRFNVAWPWAIVLVCLSFNIPLLATDYDYEAARRVWDQKRLETDAARSRFNSWQQQYNAATNELNRATQDVNRISSDLSNSTNRLNQSEADLSRKKNELRDKEQEQQRLNGLNEKLRQEITRNESRENQLRNEVRALESDINTVNQRIRDLERDGNGEAWTCVYQNDGREEHRGGHRASHARKARANDDAEAACLQAHEKCKLSECTQPESGELRRLRQRLATLEREREQKSNELNAVQRTLQADRATFERNANHIRTAENRIRQLRSEISNLERDIRDLEWSIQTLRADLERARDRESDIRTNRNQISRNLEAARTDLKICEDQELSAKLYYDQVLNNYNVAIAAARDRGTKQAQQHAKQEATERAGATASTHGRASGSASGQSAGSRDADQIAKASGYNFGRQAGSSQGNLQTFYQKGLADGQSFALSKAKVENFPIGYNEQLASILQGVPSHQIDVDISDQLPDAPEEVSHALLKPNMKVVGNQPEPKFIAPQEPTYRVPQPDQPNVQAPSADRRYYAPNCSGHDLPAFNEACTQAYASAYVSGFTSSYRSEYEAAYRQGFQASAEESYRANRSQARPDIYLAAAQQGAHEQGVLSGFAAALPEYRNAQHLEGIKAFNAYLGTGFLPVLGEVKLLEGFPDGNLSPGEEVTLQVAINNYGYQNSEQELLQVRLVEMNGIQLNVALRKLPSLPADTTMILSGVLKGKLRELLQDQAEVSFTLVLEKDIGSEVGELIDQASFKGSIRQPFSVTALRFETATAVGAMGTGVLVVANRTELENDPTNVSVESLTDAISLPEKSFDLPPIAPGSSAEIPFEYSPQVTAGGNQPVRIQLTADNLAGGNIQMIASSTIKVNRKGSLQLCLQNCNDPVAGTRVNAGVSVFFPIKFDFHSRQAERGPFVIRKSGESDSRITAANNSTYSVNLGSWDPNRSPYTGRFGYVFPASLKGTSQWIQVSLLENGKEIHRLKIPVAVQ